MLELSNCFMLGNQVLMRARHDSPRKLIDLPQFRRAINSAEDGGHLPACPDRVDMNRAVVIRVDHYTQDRRSGDGQQSHPKINPSPLETVVARG